METPFSLVYRSDAMIPVEIHESSPRFLSFVAEESNEERKVNLDLLDEFREEARIKVEAVKRRVDRQYSSKVKWRHFQVGDASLWATLLFGRCFSLGDDSSDLSADFSSLGPSRAPPSCVDSDLRSTPDDGTVHKPPSLELKLVSAKRLRLRPRPIVLAIS